MKNCDVFPTYPAIVIVIITPINA